MNLPAAAAAVSIFYLLVFCSPVSSSLTFDHGFVRYRPIARKYVSGSPLITKIDGKSFVLYTVLQLFVYTPYFNNVWAKDDIVKICLCVGLSAGLSVFLSLSEFGYVCCLTDLILKPT